MRRSEKEIKSREDIDSIIRRSVVCRIGLCDGNMPYVVPVNFGYDGSRLYFHCAKEGRKLDVLRQNNNVCFEMDIDQEFIKTEKGCGWSMKYRSVIGYGKAFSVENPADKVAAFKVIMAHYSDKEYDFSEKDADKATIVRIDIESMTGKKNWY